MKPTLSGKIEEFKQEFGNLKAWDRGDGYYPIKEMLEWIENTVKKCVQASTAVERKTPLTEPFNKQEDHTEEEQDAEWNIHCGKVWGHNICLDAIEELKKETLS